MDTLAVEETEPGFSKWHTEDAIVRGWLLKTMEPHLLGLFIELPIAHDIWESITQMYNARQTSPNIMS